MRLKLKIENLSFSGELEFTGDGETPVAVADLLERPQMLPPLEVDPVDEPAPCCAESPPPKSRKPRTTRRPKPEAEPRGELRVDTGRRTQEQTIEAIKRGQPCSPKELSERLGISSFAASQRLTKLMAAGSAQQIARGQYQLVPEA